MTEKLAIDGGTPVREKMLPYAQHWVGNEEAKAVSDVIMNKWLTEGGTVDGFEKVFADYVGAKHAIFVSSCTAAMHICLRACIKPGHEVITTPITFVATANTALHAGGRPVFADIDADTINISPESIKEKITDKTGIILPVHYGGLPCAMDEINAIAEDRNLVVIEDAAHAVGAEYGSKKIGTIGDLTCFSFHPAKQMTTGEGGMITTDNDDLAGKLRLLRAHGVNKDFKQRMGTSSYQYEVILPGFNYRMSDVNAAMGIEQLKKLEGFIEKRMEIADAYKKEFAGLPIKLPQEPDNGRHAWHLYTLQLDLDMFRADRDTIFKALRAENIGVNVLFIPVYRHPYYKALGYKPLDNTEAVFKRILTLPLFAKMNSEDVEDVIEAVSKVLNYYTV